MQFLPGSVWRATRTPCGAATTQFRPIGTDGMAVRAWGPGAEWAVETAPQLLGDADDTLGFTPAHPLLDQLHRPAPLARDDTVRLMLSSYAVRAG